MMPRKTPNNTPNSLAGFKLQWGRGDDAAEDGPPLGSLHQNRLRGAPREVASGEWSGRDRAEKPETEVVPVR
jgi:hypothetical protein